MVYFVKRKDFVVELVDFGVLDEMKELGFIILQDIFVYSWLKRGVGVLMNWYGIKLGCYWDGVD